MSQDYPIDRTGLGHVFVLWCGVMRGADTIHRELAAIREREQTLLMELGALDCAGPGRCHGAVQWCSNCGDVSTGCDDIECGSHWWVNDPTRHESGC